MQKQTLKIVFSVLLLFSVGMFFRLYALGSGSLHPDGIIYDVCRMNITAADVMNKWESLVGQTGQMPVFPAITKTFINLSRLEPTFRNVILPSAIWSSLSLLAFFGLGRKAGGTSFGLVLMAVAALNPLYIQMGREAYFYAPSVLGAALSIWTLLLARELFGSGERFPIRFYILQATALFFILYSSAGAWPFALLIAAYLFIGLLIRWHKTRSFPPDLIILALLYFCFGLPLLIASWGLPALMKLSQGESREYWTKIFAVGRSVPVLPKLSAEFLRLSWGTAGMRVVFSILVLLSGIVGILTLGRKNRQWWWLGGLFLAHLTIGVVSLKCAVWGLDIRRIAAIWASFFVILAVGLWWLWTLLRHQVLRLIGIAVIGGVAAGLWLHADILVLKMNGFPIPYQRIVQWLDSTFPPGTPVVTERFYTAGTWFGVHPATNVCIVSTMPNELPEIQKQTNSREVTRRYFETNPDAVFFQENHLYDRPEPGPWAWPETFFVHREEFIDQAAKTLCLMGQNYRASDKWSDAAYARKVYFNLPEDILARARTEGRTATALFSKGWKVVQTRDYRLWRMMQSDALIEVWNLTDAPEEATLVIQGVAAGGAKQMILNGSEKKVFPNGQVIVWTTGPVPLAPGKNLLTLRDPLQNTQVPFLVSFVNVTP